MGSSRFQFRANSLNRDRSARRPPNQRLTHLMKRKQSWRISGEGLSMSRISGLVARVLKSIIYVSVSV